MARLPFRLYASFAAERFGGNMAGVVYDDQGLATETMQQIASDLAVPTTGFVRRLDDGRFAVRFFSSRAEMDMCGHVTVAIFVALAADGRIDAGGGAAFRQLTAAGEIGIALALAEGRPQVTMRQLLPRFDLVATSAAEVAPLLGVEPAAIRSLRSAATALRQLFVELPSQPELAAIRPQDALLVDFCKRRGLDAIGVWCRQDSADALVRLRDLCHGVGDPEEAASGTTNGALACHLWRLGLLLPDADGTCRLLAEQGYEMGRPSRIATRLAIRDGAVAEVSVTGTARLRAEGHLQL